MTNRPFSCALAVASVLLLIPSLASGVNFTFEGTTPDTLVDVRFTADLSITGDNLTITLTNDSLNHANGASPTSNPNDLLTSFYFDVFNGSSRPTLLYTGAAGDVCLTDKDSLDDCSVIDKEANLRAFVANDNTWQFRDSLTFQPGTETLSFGLGTAGNNLLTPNNFQGNIVDGMDYGIYAGDVTTANLNNRLLVNETITFTFSGATGFTDADISEEVMFGLGTQPDSTGLVPEPATNLLLGLGLFGLAWLGRPNR